MTDGKTLEAGQPAPPFTLPGRSGAQVSLSDHAGKDVLVYFYPKDDTPGCTKEACSLRDSWSALQEAGVVVLGISRDDAASHNAFATKYNLPFELLTDADHAVHEAYGAWGQTMAGTGVLRKSFLVGKDGNVRHVFHKVDTGNHAHQVLAVLNPPAAQPAPDPAPAAAPVEAPVVVEPAPAPKPAAKKPAPKAKPAPPPSPKAAKPAAAPAKAAAPVKAAPAKKKAKPAAKAKAAPKPAKKAARKPAPKKAAPRKPAPKKSAPKKTASRKPAPKKKAPRKAAPKKPAPKKPAPKKPAKGKKGGKKR